MREASILAAIRQAINADGRARVLRNSVGFDPERKVRYGLGMGSPDLIGVLRSGVCFALEVKSPTGRMSKEQEAWWRSARAWGVRGGVARSVEEAMRLLDEAGQ
jgi:hypothetical protein